MCSVKFKNGKLVETHITKDDLLVNLGLSEDQAAEYDRMADKYQRQKEREEKQRIFEASGIGERFFLETIDTYRTDAPVLKAAKEAVEKFMDEVKKDYFSTLCILGGFGTGKTHLLGCCVREFYGLYALSDEIREEYEGAKKFSERLNPAGVLDKYGRVPFLAIDEIGRTKNNFTSEDEKYCLYRIINMRYNKRLPTALATNMIKKEFLDYVGSAVVDRLNESATTIELWCDSYRPKNRG